MEYQKVGNFPQFPSVVRLNFRFSFCQRRDRSHVTSSHLAQGKGVTCAAKLFHFAKKIGIATSSRVMPPAC